MERCKNDEIYGGSGWNDIFDEVVGMLFVVRLIKILKLVMKILVVLDVAVVMVVEVICDCWWVWNYKLVYTTPSTVEVWTRWFPFVGSYIVSKHETWCQYYLHGSMHGCSAWRRY